MVIKIGTLNSRGGISKISHIIDTIRRHNLDVLNLQEVHNLKQRQINELEMKTKMKCFLSPGADGARGVMTLVRESEQIRDSTLSARDDQGNSLVVELVISGEKFKVHNVYAPNSCSDRARLFKKHRETMQYKTDVIYVGDFNCVQNFELDSLGKSYKNFQAQKADREMLKEMEMVLGYTDSLRVLHPKLKLFTFTGIGTYRARLDRLYLHKSNAWMVQSASVHGVSFSDHDLYMVELKTEHGDDRVIWGKGLWKANASLLEKTEILKEVKRQWKDWQNQKLHFKDQLSWWESGKKFLKEVLIEMGRKEKKCTDGRKKEIIAKLNTAILSTTPGSAEIIRTLKTELAEIEQHELDGAAVRSRSDWASKGERATKFFFNLGKTNGKNKSISELELDGSIIRGKDPILTVIRNHYKEHFTATPIDTDAGDQLINTITRRLTDEDNAPLRQYFTMDELEAAHKKMKSGSAPGNDGLSVDFYKRFWKSIRTDLLQTLNEIFIRKQLPISMTQSILTLIYKNKGSRLELRNYRAISLLNVDFKYLTSMMNARIAPLLSKLIGPDQGGGVENRLIEDQLILIQNIYDHYKSKDTPAMIEAKDLASAFDYCSHDYLFNVLAAMKIDDSVINLLRAIYGSMHAAVAVNGAKTNYFHLTRSIRQGSPDSVSWFVCAMEPLGNLIRSCRRLHPIIVPNQPPKYVSMYVDDTTVFTTDPRDHKVIQQITTTYEKGSGARFNKQKSEILTIGKWETADMQKLPPENVKTDIKLLGVWFGPNAEKLNQQDIVRKVDNAVNFWKKVELTMQGKKLIIETKILSQIMHIARVTGICHSLRKDIQKRITNFFWHPREMAMVSMSTLQNDIQDGGQNLPNLEILNKAILVERVCKAVRYNKPWIGQLIYWNNELMRDINPVFASKDYKYTSKATAVSKTINEAYDDLRNSVSSWAQEDLKSLKQKLYVKLKSEVKLRADRDFSETWTNVHNATNRRSYRDLCYLVAHDSLPLCATLKRRRVTDNDTCQLCGREPETIRHVFLKCEKVKELKRLLERIIDTKTTRTLSEEEILYHEGRVKMIKKANELIASYKNVIWATRARLYYGEITKYNLVSDMLSRAKQEFRV